MTTEYDGEERRKDSTSVRLALLERSYFESRDSLISVHKRITEHRDDMRKGFEDLKNEIKESARGCVVCKDNIDGRLKGLEAWRNWLTGAYATAAIIVGAWWSHNMRGK